MKVKNMLSNNGNKVANQFIITHEGTRTFQSYDSIVAKIDANGNVFLDENYWDYSKTTGTYRNKFLGEGIAETRKKIKDGTYTLTNLN